MLEDQTPVFIYFSTQEKNDNIQKAIYQRDIMYEFKDISSKDIRNTGYNEDVELIVRSIEDYNAVAPIIKDALNL